MTNLEEKIEMQQVLTFSFPHVLHICICLASTVLPSQAGSQSPLGAPALWQLMSAPLPNPEERLNTANQAIADLQNAGTLDPALEIDLLRIKTDALTDLGRLGEAAKLFERKAALVEEFGLTIQHDLASLYEKAQNLHVGSGSAEAAARVQMAIRRLATNRGRNAHETASRAPEKSVVQLLYATDRARSGEPGPVGLYLPERGSLETGEVRISIPPGHRLGRVEAPSLLRLELGKDPKRHVTLEGVMPFDPGTFHVRLAEALSGARSREILVYIHGYNVSFDAAMRRAGQLAYDLQYDGVPIVYSWPSRGTTFGYVSDTAAVRHSARHLANFLMSLVDHHPDEVIHVVAHSMGNVALSDALELLALQLDAGGANPAVFDEVVFAAPDVDSGLFAIMAGTFRPLAKRMTVYASSEDLALRVSRRIHGDAPRMGQGGDRMVSIKGIESIDMSAAGDDLLAHDYFAENWTALVDILTLIWRDAPPERRCGLERTAGVGGDIWKMAPETCADRSLIEMLIDLKAIGVTRAEEVEAYLDWKKEEEGVSEQARTFLLRLFEDTEKCRESTC